MSNLYGDRAAFDNLKLALQYDSDPACFHSFERGRVHELYINLREKLAYEEHTALYYAHKPDLESCYQWVDVMLADRCFEHGYSAKILNT